MGLLILLIELLADLVVWLSVAVGSLLNMPAEETGGFRAQPQPLVAASLARELERDAACSEGVALRDAPSLGAAPAVRSMDTPFITGADVVRIAVYLYGHARPSAEGRERPCAGDSRGRRTGNARGSG